MVEVLPEVEHGPLGVDLGQGWTLCGTGEVVAHSTPLQVWCVRIWLCGRVSGVQERIAGLANYPGQDGSGRD
jgi:hypothetical protein